MPQGEARPSERIAHVDRDQAVERVKLAFVDGLLDKDEFDERLQQALRAKTRADVALIMEDLPVEAPVQVQAAPAAPALRTDAGRTLAAVANAPIFLFGPLVVLVTAGNGSPYVRQHAANALNAHLTLLIATIGLPFTAVGAVLIPFLWIGWLVLSVVGVVRGAFGAEHRYPFTFRLIK